MVVRLKVGPEDIVRQQRDQGGEVLPGPASVRQCESLQ